MMNTLACDAQTVATTLYHYKYRRVDVLNFGAIVACQNDKTNGADPDQTALKKQSDLGLHCLLF